MDSELNPSLNKVVNSCCTELVEDSHFVSYSSSAYRPRVGPRSLWHSATQRVSGYYGPEELPHQ